MTIDRHPIPLGSTTAHLTVYDSDQPGLTYIVLHDNEDTGVEAALDVIRRQGGRLLDLQHTGDRNLRFTFDGATYAVDPNRIFTDAGRRATLADQSDVALDDLPGAVVDAVAAFAEALLMHYAFEPGRTVVTVHNNTNENYTALSYAEGADYADDAAELYVVAESDADDFFFVTEPALFERVRDAGFNAVLQDNAAVTDDGSLSVYCGQQGMPYINVEAQHGKRDVQARMLAWLTEALQPVQ